MKLLSPTTWAKFRQSQFDHFDTNAEVVVIWRKYINTLELHQEDGAAYEDIPLRALIQYNAFRVWGVNKGTDSGEEDHSSLVMLINKDYLVLNNLLEANGNLPYNPGRDKFIHEGIMYHSQGDTSLSQAVDSSLLVMIILNREETPTGANKYNRG